MLLEMTLFVAFSHHLFLSFKKSFLSRAISLSLFHSLSLSHSFSLPATLFVVSVLILSRKTNPMNTHVIYGLEFGIHIHTVNISL